MQVKDFAINLTSEEPARLKAFYRDVVGLSPRPEKGEDAFDLGPSTLFIDGHSETRGAAKEPQRYLIDMFIDDLAAEQARLEAKGARFIRKGGKEYWGGMISTFVDPDGNYCQIIEYKPQ
jgi:predicted enzyme related to lactoylglutathione lyase